MNIEIIKADYLDEYHARDIGYLLNQYATDPMGGGKPLAQTIVQNIADELAKLPHAFTVMAYVDNRPAGLINCFEAFSTFSCKPLINIHDVIVDKDFRGHNLSQQMLALVESIAINKGCCKLTLEVLEGNKVAQSSYKKFGFSDFKLDPNMGGALFWQKLL